MSAAACLAKKRRKLVLALVTTVTLSTRSSHRSAHCIFPVRFTTCGCAEHLNTTSYVELPKKSGVVSAAVATRESDRVLLTGEFYLLAKKSA